MVSGAWWLLLAFCLGMSHAALHSLVSSDNVKDVKRNSEFGDGNCCDNNSANSD